MSREKQIIEIKECIDAVYGADCAYFDVDGFAIANEIYNAGYRKRSEGAWIKDEESKFEHRYHCSVCNFYLMGTPTKYCEDCGASMKGGAE